MDTRPGHGADDPTKAFYDRISSVYDRLADASEGESRRRGLELLAAGKGESVLEVGFGTGHALEELARAVGRDGEVFGVELSEGMYEVAHERLERAGWLGRVALRVGDARSLPFPDDRFDAVFMSFTLELFEGDDPPRVHAEARRVLRAGGRLGVVSMLAKEPPGVAVEIYRWLHRHFPHVVDCRPIDAPAWLETAGFEVRARDELSVAGLPVIALVAVVPEDGDTREDRR